METNFFIMCIISRLPRCNVIYAATVHHNRSPSHICFYSAPSPLLLLQKPIFRFKIGTPISSLLREKTGMLIYKCISVRTEINHEW